MMKNHLLARNDFINALREMRSRYYKKGRTKNMIALGCDHGGYGLMQDVIKHLEERGLEYKNYGCYSEESVDYPVYAKKVAHAVADGECERGILICGTGIGISITANKVPGIRAALCGDCFSAQATESIMTPISLQWEHA